MPSLPHDQDRKGSPGALPRASAHWTRSHSQFPSVHRPSRGSDLPEELQVGYVGQGQEEPQVEQVQGPDY